MAASSRKSERNFVANSSDLDDEEDILVSSPPTSKKRKFLQSVTIPTMSSGKSTPASRVARQSASSRSSFGSSTRDNSIGYDTPGTSAVATPAAEGSVAGRRSFRLGGVALNASNKRKRGSALATSSHAESSRAAESLDMSMDALLARRLQEEEYNAVEDDDDDDDDDEEVEAPAFGRSTKRKITSAINDCEADLDSVSTHSPRL
jgi:DNA repair protein RAD16